MPSISAVGNMDPLGMAMNSPFHGGFPSPFGTYGQQYYGLTAPGMLPPPIPGVPGQIPRLIRPSLVLLSNDLVMRLDAFILTEPFLNDIDVVNSSINNTFGVN